MDIKKNQKSNDRINFVILQDVKKSSILRLNWSERIIKRYTNLVNFFKYCLNQVFVLIIISITKIVNYIRLIFNKLINFYHETSDAIVDKEARTLFLFDIKVFYVITLSKLKSTVSTGWFFTKKLYLLITVVSLILGLKIATLYIKPNLSSKSFINQAFDNYSLFKNSANIAPLNAKAITTITKEIVDIFPLNKITVKADQKIEDIAEAQNLKVETIVVNNNLEGKERIPKDLKELIVPWQDGYVFFPKNEITPKELSDKYKVDEKIIYEANEDKLSEQGKFKKESTIILPTKDFTDIKKVIAKEKQLLQLEEQYKQVKDNQSKLSKSYQEQFNDSLSGGLKYSNTTSEEKVAAGLIWPTKGTISRCIQPGHPGCDIANSSMPPVYAVADGVVTDVYHFTVYGYGNAVVIDHGNGLTSLSAHLNETYVIKGQAVSQGQSIGQMGNTGNSTGTHLHIEIKQNKIVQNPLAYFP
jgi:murein DD-endopeptidase MepM/ murein hydrolase activator NlpD